MTAMPYFRFRLPPRKVVDLLLGPGAEECRGQDNVVAQDNAGAQNRAGAQLVNSAHPP